MESFPFEDRIQERIQSYRRRPGCRTAFYLLATFVISEGFCRVAQGSSGRSSSASAAWAASSCTSSTVTTGNRPLGGRRTPPRVRIPEKTGLTFFGASSQRPAPAPPPSRRGGFWHWGGFAPCKIPAAPIRWRGRNPLPPGG